MPDKSQRIIIDTNLWISFLISGHAKLDDLLFSQKAALIFSEELVQEFVNVACRPKFARYFDFQTVAELLAAIHEVAKFVKSTFAATRKTTFYLHWPLIPMPIS